LKIESVGWLLWACLGNPGEESPGTAEQGAP